MQTRSSVPADQAGSLINPVIWKRRERALWSTKQLHHAILSFSVGLELPPWPHPKTFPKEFHFTGAHAGTPLPAAQAPASPTARHSSTQGSMAKPSQLTASHRIQIQEFSISDSKNKEQYTSNLSQSQPLEMLSFLVMIYQKCTAVWKTGCFLGYKLHSRSLH